jgi:general secretion pathway protein H
VVCVLAILGVTAALVLPLFSRGTTGPHLEGYALATAAVLKADRAAAARRHVPVATLVDAALRRIQSSASGRVVQVPRDVDMDVLLPARCGTAAVESVIFLPSGLSCGGVITLARSGVGFEVRVHWLTGGVDIVPFKRS